jgi:parvulin-like peptidyl-prolyl isomerase
VSNPRTVLLSISLAAALVLIPSMSRADVVDRIIATVNDRVITLSDFYTALPIFQQLNQVPESAVATDEGRREMATVVFQELINLQLLDQQADQHELQVEDSIVDEHIGRICDQMHITLEQLQERLSSEAIDFQDFHEFIRLELTKLRVISVLVTSGITISDAEVDAVFYQRFPDGASETRFDVSQILLTPPRNATDAQIEETRAQAEQLRERVLAGESFEDLASEFSQDPSRRHGGAMGEYRRGQLPRDFEDQIMHLLPGEISPVFQSRFGFHIVRLNNKWEEASDEVDAAREQIYRELQLARQNEEIARYLTGLHEENLVQVLYDPTELF